MKKTLLIISALILPLPLPSIAAETSIHISAKDVITQLDLPEKFTLEYSVDRFDVRSPILRQSMLNEKIIQINLQMSSNTVSNKEGIDLIKAQKMILNKTQNFNTFKSTISYNGSQLYYSHNFNNILNTCLYNGKSTIIITNNKDHVQANFLSGFAISKMQTIPLLGANSLYLPLISNANFINSSQQDDLILKGTSPELNRGHAEEVVVQPSDLIVHVKDGIATARSCTLQLQSYGIDQKWTYFNHTKFADAWIPKKIVFTEYQGYSAHGKLIREPSYQYVYTLASMKTAPLPDNRFDYKEYLKPQDIIVYERDGDALTFNYKPEQSLEEQLKRAKWEKSHFDNEKKYNNGEGRSLAGIYLICSIFCVVCICVYRSRIKR